MAVVLCLILVLLSVTIIFAVFSMRNKDDEEETEYPTHFDILDENGDTIPEHPDSVVQELQYFCIKDKGYHVSVWPKDNCVGVNIEFTIAGMKYIEDIDNYLGEHVGTLDPEPTNEYDPNAIKVLAEDCHHVGYVPKNITSEIRKSATLPCTCYFYIGEKEGCYFSNCYIKI